MLGASDADGARPPTPAHSAPQTVAVAAAASTSFLFLLLGLLPLLLLLLACCSLRRRDKEVHALVADAQGLSHAWQRAAHAISSPASTSVHVAAPMPGAKSGERVSAVHALFAAAAMRTLAVMLNDASSLGQLLRLQWRVDEGDSQQGRGASTTLPSCDVVTRMPQDELPARRNYEPVPTNSNRTSIFAAIAHVMTNFTDALDVSSRAPVVGTPTMDAVRTLWQLCPSQAAAILGSKVEAGTAASGAQPTPAFATAFQPTLMPTTPLPAPDTAPPGLATPSVHSLSMMQWLVQPLSPAQLASCVQRVGGLHAVSRIVRAAMATAAVHAHNFQHTETVSNRSMLLSAAELRVQRPSMMKRHFDAGVRRLMHATASAPPTPAATAGNTNATPTMRSRWSAQHEQNAVDLLSSLLLAAYTEAASSIDNASSTPHHHQLAFQTCLVPPAHAQSVTKHDTLTISDAEAHNTCNRHEAQVSDPTPSTMHATHVGSAEQRACIALLILAALQHVIVSSRDHAQLVVEELQPRLHQLQQLSVVSRAKMAKRHATKYWTAQVPAVIRCIQMARCGCGARARDASQTKVPVDSQSRTFILQSGSGGSGPLIFKLHNDVDKAAQNGAGNAADVILINALAQHAPQQGTTKTTPSACDARPVSTAVASTALATSNVATTSAHGTQRDGASPCAVAPLSSQKRRRLLLSDAHSELLELATEVQTGALHSGNTAATSTSAQPADEAVQVAAVGHALPSTFSESRSGTTPTPTHKPAASRTALTTPAAVYHTNVMFMHPSLVPRSGCTASTATNAGATGTAHSGRLHHLRLPSRCPGSRTSQSTSSQNSGSQAEKRQMVSMGPVSVRHMYK
ncbi:MAG: hypothetical protein EOO65_00240 [Methanosarcinales archaeon]|nr:MAG: hypothetical protein EOO65_00240 [Methanosarcinales archaeon]